MKTDCAALQWLTQTKTHGARVMRWIMRLQEFELEIQHRKGKHSTDVDGLTRESAQSTRPYDESVIEELYPSFFVKPCVFQVKTRSADAHAKDKQSESTQNDSGLDFKHGGDEISAKPRIKFVSLLMKNSATRNRIWARENSISK